MSMTQEERVMRTIRREELDYLPSQITFSDRTRMQALSEAMGFNSVEELDHYLENHFYMTLSLDDVPLFYRNDVALMQELESRGFCSVDRERGIVYDRWGVGIDMNSDGFFPVSHPLVKGDEKVVQKFRPNDLEKADLFTSDVEAIRAYQAPDPDKDGIFEWMEHDLPRHSGDYMVFPSGYIGIYERAYLLMGYEEFMTGLSENREVVEELLDKITDYKIHIAQRVVQMGFKVAHYGDDLGTQCGPMFSKTLFREVLKPRMARLWKVYQDAGIPIIMHSCGHITDLIPDLIEIGLNVLEPTQPVMDLEYLKREFGKDLVFWGGIDTQHILPNGTPEQVKELATRTIRTLGKGGGHIIAPAQEVMKDVPIPNVRALVETINAERAAVLSL